MNKLREREREKAEENACDSLMMTKEILKPIMTINDVSRFTGLKESTIYVLIYKKEIPYFKFGPRLVRFHGEEILLWMKNRQYTPLKDVVAAKRRQS